MNEKTLKLPVGDLDYDAWLEFFRVQPASNLARYEKLRARIPTEGYAALKRWQEIIESPSKMDKLYQGRLKAENDKNIMDIAVGDDDEAFYEALIRENVQQLNTSNISQQEVARLTQNINIFRKELREIRSRKPKKGTVLEKVLEKAEMTQNNTKNTKKSEKIAKNDRNGKKISRKVNNRGKNKASKTRSKAKLESETGKVSSKKEENGD